MPTPERRGNDLKGLNDFYLQTKARIWPILSYLCHIRWEAVRVGSPLRWMEYCVRELQILVAQIPTQGVLVRDFFRLRVSRIMPRS